MRRIRKWFNETKEIGPHGPLVVLACILLGLFTASRLAMLLFYWARISLVKGAYKVLFAGLSIDVLTIFITLTPLALFLILLSKERAEKLWFLPTLYTIVLLGCTVFSEAAAIPFSNEFDCRPNRIFIEYMSHLREVLATIFVSFKAGGVVAILSIVLGFLGSAALGYYLFKEVADGERDKRRKLLIGYLLILMAASHDVVFQWPGVLSMSAVTEDRLTNNIALNSPSSVACALLTMSGREIDSTAFFGHMKKDEIFQRLKKYTGVPKDKYKNPDQPLLRLQNSALKVTHPRNLVIIVEESMGAGYVGSLGGLDLTPNLDELAKEGFWLSSCYANGDRTVRGLEAVVAGFTQTPGRGITKLGPAPKKMFTLARLLAKRGYDTEFIYAGDKNFDYMWSFFKTAGFHKVYDESEFDEKAFHAPWGVDDKTLLERAHKIFLEHKKPFFSLVLTTSVHDPFYFPDGAIEVKGPKHTLHNAIRFADSALGHFFTLAKKADYFKDTIFLVVADHNIRTKGPGILPIEIFHVPALFIGPSVPERTHRGLCSQIDLLPTALHFLGLHCSHPAYGRNLATLSPNENGRFLVASGYQAAFRFNDLITFYRPLKEPLQYQYTKDDKLKSVKKIDKEMVRDGLAHLLAPALLYYDGLYELAPE